MNKIYSLLFATVFFPFLMVANTGSRIEKKWNKVENKWDKISKLDYTYSSKTPSECTEVLNSFWNQYSEAWVQSQKRVNLFDVQGNLQTSVSYNYYAPSESWIATSKEEYSYNGDQVTCTNYKYNNYVDREEDWSVVSRVETKKSELKNISSEKYGWNSDASKWQLQEKRNYNYNISGLLATEIVELFNKEGGKSGNQQITYSYDSNNNLLVKEVIDDHKGCDHGGKFTYEYN